MQTRGIHLQYSFESRGQRGPEVENPLFDLLNRLQEHGSIRHAATAMGASYRHVWGSLKHWEEVMGEPLVQWSQGQAARLTPFAQRLLAAERQARTRMTPHIEALRAELEHVLAQALDGAQLVLEVFASHDPGLPLLRELAQQQHQLHVGLRFAGSVDALRALAHGRCTVAGFHVPALPDGSPVFSAALKPLLKPGLHKLIGCLRRQQGLMLRPTGAIERRLSLTDLPGSGLRFVNRQPGSATRLLMDHLLQAAGVDAASIDGYAARPEDSHLAVAAAIAGGQADVGPGIEAAACEFNLDFIPLVEEDYFLVCLKDALDSAPVRALRTVLESPAWPQALQALPGYAAPDAGRVLSLTKALPWWHFRTPKGQAA
ncbi:substrate-binding domain-containing protein [Azohydromonas aeria]|uniref:helix-turn-helix transcriptional regulator n=1 Tax=Azohydromonas aeria TaxID=2590212 RepID=UPI0012FBFFF8|nr:substrate-binding domain-containing protein [Azohydromonas aeria]